MPTNTREGYTWTSQAGMKRGNFDCEGVISTPQRIKKRTPGFVYDTIVIGAGYAGLSAGRDLAIAGRSVLLLEGRDRVGGRTYTIKEDGFNFDMGGAWISYHQPNTLRELIRYDLDRDLTVTPQAGHQNDYFSLRLHDGSRKDLTQEKAAELSGRAWNIFVNVDGESGKKVCPLPHQSLGNVRVNRDDVEKWDRYSSYDRLQEVKDELSEEEIGLLIPMLLSIHGGNPDLKTSAFWDIIQAHALNGYRFENMNEIWLTYKLRQGQSHFARVMFDDAVDFDMEYTFNTHVQALKHTEDSIVSVVTADGREFLARKVICTTPLSMLRSLKFDPPLTPLRQEAIDLGHINYMTKIHAVVQGSGMASWNGSAYPNNLVCAYGDGILPSGDAHLVAFGADERLHFVPEKHPEKAVEAFQKFHPMHVKKLLFHNWNTDPYSQGGPSYWAPGYKSKYQEELQKRHHNIFFASADWARGWRLWIDGALEQGVQNALDVLRELRIEDKERIQPVALERL